MLTVLKGVDRSAPWSTIHCHPRASFCAVTRFPGRSRKQPFGLGQFGALLFNEI